MTDAHGVARDQLRAFIERIERLEEEKKTIADDIKDVYGEAKGMGFDTVIMKRVVALRKKDEQQRMEEEAVLDTYLHALGMIAQHDLFEEPHHPETGEIIDPKLAQTIVTGMQTETGRKALIAAVDIMIAREVAEETPSADIRAEGREVGDVISSVESEDSVPGHQLVDAAASLNEPDDDAIAAVNGKAGLANVVDVEPSSSVSIAPASQGEAEAPSLDSVSPQAFLATTGSVGANAGGGHVNAQSEAAQRAGALAKPAPAHKPLRPHCRNPGEHCGGYGSNHCHSCLRAAKEAEVAA